MFKEGCIDDLFSLSMMILILTQKFGAKCGAKLFLRSSAPDVFVFCDLVMGFEL